MERCIRGFGDYALYTNLRFTYFYLVKSVVLFGWQGYFRSGHWLVIEEWERGMYSSLIAVLPSGAMLMLLDDVCV